MADSKLSALTEATTLGGTDELYANDSGTSKRITATNLATTAFSLFGVTSTAAELNILDGVTATAEEINILDGVTATAAEINFVDGVTSSVQGQIDSKGTVNHIINGGMSVAQRGTSFTGGTANANDAYTLDRWYILSDGNDIVDVTRSAEAPANGQYSIALDVETANKKFGIAQIIERSNCKGLIGETVTLSFKAKVSATTKLDNVKAAIVAWSGTADTVTSNIISAWGAEGANPTLIANATFENTPDNLSVTTDWATYSVSADIDTASTSNIIVFVWSDVTDTTAGDFLYITDVLLEKNSAASRFPARDAGLELMLCQRYYELGTILLSTDITLGGNSYLFATQKRTTPTLTLTPNAGAGAAAMALDSTGFYQSTANNAVTGGVFTATAEL